MKTLFSISIFFLFGILYSQQNTDVYVFDIQKAYEGLEVLNMRNISNDPGYDNQPSFINNDEILFAGNKNGQTDIAKYNLKTNEKTWVNATTPGGEFSPKQIPGSENMAAVRLDPNGLQRLYEYDSETQNSSELIENLQIAYFAFHDENIIVSTVLNFEEMDLVVSNLKEKTTDTILQNAGRSIHKVPDSKFMSYTAINEEGNHEVFLLEMETRESYFVCQLPIGIQDFTWLNDAQMLLGSGNKLYLYDTLGTSEWTEVAVLEHGFSNITRLAVSPDGKRLAVVAEPE